jgi:hypothetical protein
MIPSPSPTHSFGRSVLHARRTLVNFTQTGVGRAPGTDAGLSCPRFARLDAHNNTQTYRRTHHSEPLFHAWQRPRGRGCWRPLAAVCAVILNVPCRRAGKVHVGTWRMLGASECIPCDSSLSPTICGKAKGPPGAARTGSTPKSFTSLFYFGPFSSGQTPCRRLCRRGIIAMPPSDADRASALSSLFLSCYPRAVRTWDLHLLMPRRLRDMHITRLGSLTSNRCSAATLPWLGCHCAASGSILFFL